jgi:hypothetical protein
LPTIRSVEPWVTPSVLLVDDDASSLGGSSIS